MATPERRRSSLKDAMLSHKTRRGLIARFLFTAHATMCVYQTAFFLEDSRLWLMLSLLGVMYVDFIIVAFFRQGKEWKWFFVCIFCYLMVVLPALWLLELDVLENRLELRENDDDDCGVKDIPVNTNNTIDFIAILGLDGTGENWSLILQQILIFVLIIGRWILPRGHLTGDQHSQLLLIYIGTGADILEFAAEGLRLDEIRCDSTIIYAILIIWTISILQFTLPLTATTRRPSKYVANRCNAIKMAVGKCCGTESWAVLVAILLQDGPFLGVRLYLLFYKQVINELLLFFACKNVLTIILQGNRLYTLLNQKRELRRGSSRRIPFLHRIARAAQNYIDQNPDAENVAGVENGMQKSKNITDVNIEMPESNNVGAENVAYESENIEIGTRAEDELEYQQNGITSKDESKTGDHDAKT